jgi:hypothetical protein
MEKKTVIRAMIMKMMTAMEVNNDNYGNGLLIK